jgi:hypothetical protein
MAGLEFNFRLIPGVSAEQEWLYLMDESYAGEQCIVPLLHDLLEAPVESVGFFRMIRRQIVEEQEHVQRYAAILGGLPGPRSGYEQPFTAYVRSLPNTTLKIFCLQALLEGIGLGALRYRSEALARTPAAELDRRLQLDEARHVRFAYAFMRALIATDGVVPVARFNEVASAINSIFANHFSAASLAAVMYRTFGVVTEPELTVASVGMRRFFHVSVNSVVETKREFLKCYRGACEAR